MGLAIVLALLVYVVSAILIARFFAHKQKKLKGKIIVSLSCIFIAILIPTWDIPIIKWKFNQLCKNEAGIHVYEQVVLPPKYWNEDGTFHFPKNKTLKEIIPLEFKTVSISKQHNSLFQGIRKFRWKIVREKNNNVIGEYIRVSNKGGWLARWFQSSIKHCPPSPNPRERISEKLVNSVYKKNSTK